MTSIWFFILCQSAIIACGLVAGVFLTFSDFVMRSLDKVDAAAGVEVMQTINREVFKWVFMALLLGMSALSPLLIVYAYINLTGPAAALIMAGGSVYLLGVLGVTRAFNIPMNNRLAAMEHDSAAASAYWKKTYVPSWTFWNTVRVVASTASAICFLLAMIRLVPGL